MKQLLLLAQSLRRSWCSAFVALGLATGPVHAQVDTYQFAASQGSYVPLPAAATSVPAVADDDAMSGALPLGFSFVFDGAPYTNVYVSSNGFLSFNSAATSSLTNGLATAAANNRPLVAPLWDDLSGEDPTAVAAYQTTGSAPNRVFTFEWRNWYWNYNAAAPVISFQVKLYETTNRVEFVYRPGAGMPNNASASIGLAGAGTMGSYLSLNGTGPAPTASSTTETTSLNVPPAAGRVYAFTAPTITGCGTPRNLAAAAITATSATLSWGVTSGGGTFVIEYGPAGFTPGTGSQTVTSTTTSVTVTGLTASTDYQFYVTQLCPGGTSSPRSSASAFRTNCLTPAYASVPFIEPFDSTWLSRCNTREVPSNNWRTTPATGNPSWRRNDDGAAAGWSSPTFGAYVPTGTQGSARSARFHSSYSSSGSIGTLDLFVNLSGAGNKELSFDYINTSGNDSLTVQVSEDGGATFGPLLLRLGVSASFATRTLALTSTSATAVVRFRARADFGSTDIGLDNVSIASCPRVSNVAVSNITGTSATVTFTPVAGVSSYTVVATPATGPPITVTPAPTGSPVQLTGLQGLTQYVVSVTSNCGPGRASAPATATFTTLVAPATNDEPCTATVLPVGTGSLQSTTGTNQGATPSSPNGYNNPGCSTANNPRDVWFRVVMPATGPTSLTLVASGNPAGQVRVFSAPSCNGPFTQISCQAGAGPNTAAGAQVVSGLTAGATYYVSVSGFSSSDATGAFTLQAGQGTLLAAKGELPGGSVSVYPNPSATGQLTLRIAGAPAGAAQATLLNALGQQVLHQAVSVRAGAAEVPLAVPHLAKGIYTLRVQIGDVLVARKVVLE